MSDLNYQVIKRNPTIYEQLDIFGGKVIKADSKVGLVVKRKEDGKYLKKMWWKCEEKYTDLIDEACIYKKRNHLPHDDRDIKRIIISVIKKKIITEKEWSEFINAHIFEQMLM